MNTEYKQKLEWAKKNKKVIKQEVAALKKMRKGDVDKLIHPLHEKAFACIDCLQCANCCTTTSPLLSKKDIDRIANYLDIKATTFTDKYLRLDEDNDLVLKTLPCTFLDKENYCSIYEVRPKACREYPHTDRKNQQGILSITQKNATICPAVAHIFNNLTR